MKTRISTILIMLLVICASLSGCANALKNTAEVQDTLYQVSTLDALMQGVYDGEITLKELLDHGDFGIGTFEGLDGEMVVLDKTVYQVLSTGKVVKTDDSVKTPFAMVTGFEADTQADVKDISNYAQLKSEIDTLLPSQNIFYAIKIQGTFSHVKTRSVPAQTKPYPRLSEVTDTQPVFDYNEVAGTLVGYWCPEYIDGINLAGYHLHFLSDDKEMGGHLLECSIKDAVISLDTTTEFQMQLPGNENFSQVDLDGVSKEEKQDVEQ